MRSARVPELGKPAEPADRAPPMAARGKHGALFTLLLASALVACARGQDAGAPLGEGAGGSADGGIGPRDAGAAVVRGDAPPVEGVPLAEAGPADIGPDAADAAPPDAPVDDAHPCTDWGKTFAPPCVQCLDQNCCPGALACRANPRCYDLLNCQQQCPPQVAGSPDPCITECAKEYPGSAPEGPALGACLLQHCPGVCP